MENGHGPLHDAYMTSNGDHDFTALQPGPPHRRFCITRDPPMTSNTQVRGWAFGYDEMRVGEWETGWGTWEEWFFEILRYPAQHSSENLVWRGAITGEVVDLASLRTRPAVPRLAVWRVGIGRHYGARVRGGDDRALPTRPNCSAPLPCQTCASPSLA